MLTLQCDTILNINQLGMIFFAYQQTLPPIWLGIVSQQWKVWCYRTVPSIMEGTFIYGKQRLCLCLNKPMF